MRKVDDGENKYKKREKNGENVVASRPPERRPTATPTARANKAISASIEVEVELS